MDAAAPPDATSVPHETVAGQTLVDWSRTWHFTTASNEEPGS
jgi:hypothetical protein